ncbi:MAG: hypothetical protein HY961_06775 [Ignavibacteriae bacterium]|nr:hypothetical protein [Ignavibacteriota bacterium]
MGADPLSQPIIATDVSAEFDQLTSRCAFLDRSSCGRIVVTGNDRLDLLHRLSTNDLLKHAPGDVVSTVFTTEKGRIIDYVQVGIRESSLLLFCSAGMEETLSAWIDKYTIMDDVRLEGISKTTVLFSVIGPESLERVSSTLDLRLTPNSIVDAHLKFGEVTVLCRIERDTVICDLVARTDDAKSLRDLLQRSETEIEEGSQDAFEFYRISRGVPNTGSELNESYNPFDIGLLDAVGFSKGCYIGQEVIARLDTYQKAQKSLYGLISDAAQGSVPAGSTVLVNDTEAGTITSASRSSVRGKQVMMAVLKKELAHADDSYRAVQPGRSYVLSARDFPINV